MSAQYITLDCEVYPNYFLAAFKNIVTKQVVTIEAKNRTGYLTEEDRERLRRIMFKRCTFGFNSNNYDIPIIFAAMRSKTCEELCEISNKIIGNNLKGWQIANQEGLTIPKHLNHFDIQEPSPGVKVSLKTYGGRLHSHRIQDLPIEPNTDLTPKEMVAIKTYCINDLDTNIDLFNKIEDRINLRIKMGEKYKLDLRSKSDAQIAEIVIKSELQKKTKKKIKAPKVPEDAKFRYNAPNYIKFKTPELKEALEIIKTHEFEIDGKGSIKLPKRLKALKIQLGYSTYQLGVGGIHSNEKKQSIVPKDHQMLCDQDVESFYPKIILNLGLFPKHLGIGFLKVYKAIVDERLEAKKNGDKVVNESLKIVINGSFGKLGNKWSCLYSPDLMMTVTLTGQLSLLMLIEELEEEGINVVSANTDGFVSLFPKSKYKIYKDMCDNWQKRTNFVLEENPYKALYSSNVNNYLAVKLNGEGKGKGIFTLNDIQKNPQGDISTIAVKEYLINKVPIQKTIKECTDITKFVSVRNVAGGGTWRDEYLGKVARWIYSTDGDPILYKKTNAKGNHNKVAKSDGARPLMELTDIPEDLDYNRYIEESFDIMENLGLYNL